MDKQRTIEKAVSIKGIGIHTASKVSLTFKPAEPDSGINFVRVDLPNKPVIKAVLENVLALSYTMRRTSLGKEGAEIHTIEHLMAAIRGRGIDNLIIEIDNNEIPGVDGSSIEFFDILTKAGIKDQNKPKRYYFVKDPVFVEDSEGGSIAVLPCDDFRISYTLSYDHPLLKAEHMKINITEESFEKEIASARTFCLEDEADKLQRQGLGKGANYDNTIVLGKKGVIKNTLRFDDEFVRHKILDLIGDIYLFGHPLKAHVIALKSGHSLNLKLVKKLVQQRQRHLLGGIGIGYQTIEHEELDINTIMKILPHRQPFLFVDRVIHLEQGKCAVGIKNVTINDDFFRGHFPGRPVMPGVLIVEAMAQVGGVMMLSPEANRGKLAFFMSADNIKFRRTVVPGDQLVFEVVAKKVKAKTGQVHGRAFVDGKLVTEADLMFALVE